ncbi:MAG: MaoC family dehydratase, partial [Bacteriovoracaceae bacterium]|nr:MaoC family dehydratase [Bacteriovoracaceae bacterium]
SDVRHFAELTGDHNPVHLFDEEAKKLGFKSRIAHGMLSASFFSAILANKFPGPGAIYLGQSIKFHAPVYLNEELTYELEVIAQKEGKPIFTISTVIKNSLNEILVSGEAVIRAPKN